MGPRGFFLEEIWIVLGALLVMGIDLGLGGIWGGGNFYGNAISFLSINPI